MAFNSLSTQPGKDNTHETATHDTHDTHDSPATPLADAATEEAIAALKATASQFRRDLEAVYHCVHKPSFFVPRTPGYVLGLYSLDKLHYSFDYMVDYAVLNARMLAAMTEAARRECGVNASEGPEKAGGAS